MGNVRASTAVVREADRRGVSIHTDSVIYRVVDHIRKALSDHLPPEIVEDPIGKAIVKQSFPLNVKPGSNPKVVAGCQVVDGEMRRSDRIFVRVTREGEMLHDGKRIEELRHFQEVVSVVKQGNECGLLIASWTDVLPDDVIELYEKTEHARELPDIF